MTKEQLGSLILASEKQMYATAKSILKQDTDCADAIQEAIVKAFGKVDDLKQEKYARTWLMRILMNECYNILRKSSRQVSLEACIVVGTAAFAAVSMYHLKMKENGKYGVDTQVVSDVDKDKAIPLPEELAEVRIQADYIPKGMKKRDEFHLEYKDSPAKGGFSFFTYILDTKSDELNLTDKNVVEKEKTDFGDHEGIYLRMKRGTSYSQKIYLLYPELYRILQIYISEDVSKEEAYKVASNIKLIETEKIMDPDDVKWTSWSAYVQEESRWKSGASGGDVRTSVLQKDLKIHKIGEQISLEVSGTDSNRIAIWTAEKETGIDITASVESVEVADDLSLLEEEYIYEGWKKAVGPDGKLLKNQLSYIKCGDGIDTLDEVIKTEETEQKLVFITTVYTNQGDQEINNMLYKGNLMLLREADDEYQVYTYEGGSHFPVVGSGYDEASGKTYDRIEQSGVAWTWGYWTPRADYGNGGNYISLKAGESIRTKEAWIVNEQDLEHLYLNLTGESMEFNEDMIRTGLVDVRQ